MNGSVTSTFSPAAAATSHNDGSAATAHISNLSLEIKPAATAVRNCCKCCYSDCWD